MIDKFLIQLADKLDTLGHTKVADAVDDVMANRSLHKMAQYVGAIGYVLRQNRAMGNCIRKKRVASKKAMQEVVMECLSEYQKGNSYNDTEWAEKYASIIRKKPSLFKDAHITLLAQISEANELPDHVAKVREVCSMLDEVGVDHDEIKNIVDNFNEVGKIIQKEVGG